MSCPICGEHCRCAEPRAYASTVTFVDIDEYDPTEEQFASSVMTGISTQDDGQELVSGTLASAQARHAKSTETETQNGLPPHTQIMEPQVTEQPSESDAWRNDVASCLQSYKARRRRSMGDENLTFNFESTAGNHVFLRPEHEPEPVPYTEPEPAPNYYAPHACATEPAFDEPVQQFANGSMPQEQERFSEVAESEPEPEEEPKPAPILETAKLIFFPKPPVFQDYRPDELAEPVFETPRILEAPEHVEGETVAIPLADISLHPEVPEDLCVPHAEPAPELPFRVAPMAQRIFAEICDSLLVLVASGMFGIIVAKLNPNALTLEKHALVGVLVLVPAVLWSIYKYLFLVHGGKTIGMQMARLRLVYFDGYAPARVPRRFRALAMLVSIFPLGLGLLWSFVDPDTLCWHDRISRTYMTAR